MGQDGVEDPDAERAVLDGDTVMVISERDVVDERDPTHVVVIKPMIAVRVRDAPANHHTPCGADFHAGIFVVVSDVVISRDQVRVKAVSAITNSNPVAVARCQVIIVVVGLILGDVGSGAECWVFGPLVGFFSLSLLFS